MGAKSLATSFSSTSGHLPVCRNPRRALGATSVPSRPFFPPLTLDPHQAVEAEQTLASALPRVVESCSATTSFIGDGLHWTPAGPRAALARPGRTRPRHCTLRSPRAPPPEPATKEARWRQGERAQARRPSARSTDFGDVGRRGPSSPDLRLPTTRAPEDRGANQGLRSNQGAASEPEPRTLARTAAASKRRKTTSQARVPHVTRAQPRLARAWLADQPSDEDRRHAAARGWSSTYPRGLR